MERGREGVRTHCVSTTRREEEFSIPSLPKRRHHRFHTSIIRTPRTPGESAEGRKEGRRRSGIHIIERERGKSSNHHGNSLKEIRREKRRR